MSVDVGIVGRYVPRYYASRDFQIVVLIMVLTAMQLLSLSLSAVAISTGLALLIIVPCIMLSSASLVIHMVALF